jgi:23S rRNA (uracil1939-C5)-methyltransferase
VTEEITITNIAYGGFGIGRISGKAIFVDSALPGDILQIDIFRETKNYSFARQLSIIRPSPLRIEPECPVFGKCGGCSYLNVDYTTEIDFKLKILAGSLQRIAGLPLDDIPEIDVIADSRFSYRSHAAIKISGKLKGFYAGNSNSFVEFPEQGCRLLCDVLNDGIRKLKIDDDVREIKVARDQFSGFINSLNSPDKYILESDYNFKFRHDLSGFYQANMNLREKMIERVIEYASPEKNDVFIDIFCGCGFFSLPLASVSGRGHGFDSDKRSICNAVHNMKINNIDNISFEVRAESGIHPHRYKPDFIVVDPPRNGISKKGRNTINAIRPSRLIYVSCDPSTFARDAADFIKQGMQIKQITMIDMFPCTKHIELIACFMRRKV